MNNYGIVGQVVLNYHAALLRKRERAVIACLELIGVAADRKALASAAVGGFCYYGIRNRVGIYEAIFFRGGDTAVKTELLELLLVHTKVPLLLSAVSGKIVSDSKLDRNRNKAFVEARENAVDALGFDKLVHRFYIDSVRHKGLISDPLDRGVLNISDRHKKDVVFFGKLFDFLRAVISAHYKHFFHSSTPL